MRRLLVAASIVALALTLVACAPDTSTASANCARTFTEIWKMGNPDASGDAVLEQALEYAELCEAAAEADPAGFVEEWG